MRRFVCSISLSLFLVNVVFVAPSAGQDRRGAISGMVTDTGHGVLKGATVDLQPAGKPAVTDSQGQFTVSDLPPGEYILTISYVGLEPFTKKITVSAGQTTRTDAELQVAAQSESITVTAERPHGEAEAINRE